MAGSVLRAGLTNFPVSVTGGHIPDDNLIIDVSTWAEALEPRKTPLLTMFGMGAPINTRPHYFGQSFRVALETTVAEALDNSETGIDVASGTGKLFQKNTLFEVVDFIAGSSTILDQSTAEVMLVTADPAADTLTVERGYAGTSAVSHSSGAFLRIIGIAEAQLTTHSISPVARGTRNYNYVQRMAGGVKQDKAAQSTPTWEHKSNPMIADFEEEQKRQKLLLEMSIWHGRRYAGNNDTTPKPATMGGLGVFITTNVTNMAQAKLTPRVLEAELRDLAKNTDGGPEGLMLLMSYETAAIFDMLIDPIRMATANDNELNLTIERVKFRFGTFDIMVSHNAPNGVIYGIRKENIKVRPFEGLNWHVSKKEGKVHGVDHDEWYVSGDFTLEVLKEHSMFKLHSFNENLSAYDAYSTWAS